MRSSRIKRPLSRMAAAIAALAIAFGGAPNAALADSAEPDVPSGVTGVGYPIVWGNSSDAMSIEASDDNVTWHRLGENNRYETMSAIVSEGFSKSDWAILATGEKFPDALSASALAGARKCPVILTDSKALSAEAKSQLTRLGVKNVYLMGGEATIGKSVESAVAGMGIKVRRVAGSDRVATSVEAFKAVREASPTSGTVLVATGNDYPDALSMGPWSYVTVSPIMLTNAQGKLSDDAVAAIKADKRIKSIVMLGGTSAVSDEIRDQMGSDYSIGRIGGASRYQTSARIAEWTVKSGHLTWATPAIATGKNFPDALAGAPMCGAKTSVLLVADNIADVSLESLRANKDQIAEGFLLGGSKAMRINDPLAMSARAGLKAASGERAVVPFGGYTPSQGVLDRINAEINSLHAQDIEIGLIMMDLTSLKGIAYNCDGLFYSASSIKGPYLASVVNLHPEAIHEQEYNITETLFYSWDHTYKNVLAIYGNEPMRVFCQESGANPAIAESLPWVNYSARDMALLWARIYQLFGQGPEGAQFGRWLERPNVSPIHESLGGAYLTRSKAGFTSFGGPIVDGVNNNKPLWDVLDDAGIVYSPKGDYVMAIMSNVPFGRSSLNAVVLAVDGAHNEM